MTGPDILVVPVLHQGVLLARIAGQQALPDIAVSCDLDSAPSVIAMIQPGRALLDPVPRHDLTLRLSQPGAESPGTELQVQVGGWAGAVDWVHGGVISGWARNLRSPARDCAIVAFDSSGIRAVATARADAGGHFDMILPADITRAPDRVGLRLGIAGSDYLLDGGILAFGGPLRGTASARITAAPLEQMAIRIKISCPNLKEAPQWGDYHFANSLAASFERIGLQAGVDTADAWYAHPAREDVVLAIRGRHRLKVDRSKINIMWLISHPDRIPEDEYADYDHIAVASDIYAAELKSRGLPAVSVLHQATDVHVFRPDDQALRQPVALFVGNSRREYRTMVKWCVQKTLPLELYGGGWDGILPDGVVRAQSIANADLPRVYGNHLILLNDHWDSMRDNGFLSNRLFDGSAVGTPILTDPVAGLADVFGDTISTADTIDSFAATLNDCLTNPDAYLERAARARDIVIGAHSFDHRARQLAGLIDRVAATRRRLIA